MELRDPNSIKKKIKFWVKQFKFDRKLTTYNVSELIGKIKLEKKRSKRMGEVLEYNPENSDSDDPDSSDVG